MLAPPPSHSPERGWTRHGGWRRRQAQRRPHHVAAASFAERASTRFAPALPEALSLRVLMLPTRRVDGAGCTRQRLCALCRLFQRAQTDPHACARYTHLHGHVFECPATSARCGAHRGEQLSGRGGARAGKGVRLRTRTPLLGLGGPTAQMEGILDFTRPLDISLLDRVVMCMNDPRDSQVCAHAPPSSQLEERWARELRHRPCPHEAARRVAHVCSRLAAATAV